jgi:hypothetical protein
MTPGFARWEIRAGNTATLTPTFYDPDVPGAKIDLTPYTIRFSATWAGGEIYWVSGGSDPVVKLTQSGATLGQFSVTISPALTRSMAPYSPIIGEVEMKLGAVEESWTDVEMIFTTGSNRDG